MPDDVEPRDLDKVARNELKTLSKENADWVAKHLVMASRLIEEDPELAHRHAMSAARRAGRIAVVRESLAITAYETGDYALALRELRTFRRISGSDEQLPLMVDSERGVGRPEKALELGRSVDRSTLTPASQVSLAIAMSGARLDLGSPELALGELEIPQLDPDRAFSYSAALYDAYAEVLSELGRDDEATVWRRRATVAGELFGDGPDEDETIVIIEEGGDAPEGSDADGAHLDDDDLEDAEPGAVDAGLEDEPDSDIEPADDETGEVATDDADAGDAVSNHIASDGIEPNDIESNDLESNDLESNDIQSDDVETDETTFDDADSHEGGAADADDEPTVADDDANRTDTEEDVDGVVRPHED